MADFRDAGAATARARPFETDARAPIFRIGIPAISRAQKNRRRLPAGVQYFDSAWSQNERGQGMVRGARTGKSVDPLPCSIN
jgi:hypothetical protein